MIAVIVICLVPVMIIVQAWVKILDDESYCDDARFCDGCQCGWCMAVPDDEECKKWRDKHGNENT